MSFDDDADEDSPEFRRPPHPDDRLWRHPSELGGGPAGPLEAPATTGRRRSRPRGLLPAVASAGLLAGFATGALVLGGGGGNGGGPDARSTSSSAAVAGPRVFGDQADTTEVVRVIGPALVAVHAPSGADQGPGVVGLDGVEDGWGSGVIIRGDGIVLTSAELLVDVDAAPVRLADGTEAEAPVIGVDRVTGLGVLDLPGDGYATAALAAPGDLAPGTTAFSVGLASSGTEAVAGVIGTSERLGEDVFTDETGLDGVVEVDGETAPGSLGGPVVNELGAVIGIITATGGDAASPYITPIEVSRRVADDMLTTGEARHSWLGIEGRDASPGGDADTAGADTTGESTTGSSDSSSSTGGDSTGSTGTEGTSGESGEQPGSGAEVSSIVDGGPAALAGLEVGDVIVEFDGRPISDMADLVLWLRFRSPGEQVEVVVLRDGELTTVTVSLGAPPAG